MITGASHRQPRGGKTDIDRPRVNSRQYFRVKGSSWSNCGRECLQIDSYQMRLPVHGVAQEQRWAKQLKFPDMEAWNNQFAIHRFQFQCVPKQFAYHIRPRLFLWYGLALNITTCMDAKFEI